ncbi:MAG: hypothetical protein MI784_16175, partial [Cytophagales bacterium]|nr:hypothetical protein [Cytophagales bacterium]
CGEIREFHFWPHWDGTSTGNTNFVEPDVFLRFNSFDLIIEAKRHDDNQQYEGQWRNELIAYRNEYGEDEKTIYIIALGGINDEDPFPLSEEKIQTTVYMSRWNTVLREVRKRKRLLDDSNEWKESNESIRRVLDDIIMSFGIYGFSTAKWFEDFSQREKIRKTSIDCFLKKD